MSEFRMDKIMSSHSTNLKTITDLSKHTSRGSLIIYLHREETDRLLSAIKQVAERLCKSEFEKFRLNEELESTIHAEPVNKTHCVLHERSFFDIIEQRPMEIQHGPDDILRCEAYEAIEQSLPNLVFLHYKQQNRLQSLLAKHYCPHMNEPVTINVFSNKTIDIFIQSGNDKEEVHTISDWLVEKGDMIEWSLKMKGRGCQYKTRKIEDALFDCKDEIYQISG